MKIDKPIAQFFKVQIIALKELLNMYKMQTILILFLSGITISTQFINLKLLEYLTNSMSKYIDGVDVPIRGILLGSCVFLFPLLFVSLLTNEYKKVLERYNSNVSAAVEKKLCNKLSSISYEYYESSAFYEKINIAKEVGNQYAQAVYGITQSIQLVVTFVVYGVMLSSISSFYVGIVLFSIIVSTAISTKVTDKQLEYWRKHVSPEARRNGYFKNIFSNRINHQNIQTTRTYSYFGKWFKFYNSREKQNYLKLNVFSLISDLGSSIPFFGTFFVTSIIVARGVAVGKYEIGYFTMVIALLVDFLYSIKQYAYFMLNQNWYVKVLSEYYEVLNLNNYSNTNTITSDSDGIELKNVQYKYAQSQKYALNGVNLTVQKGQKIAIVGENGSGKTTMVSIILGLLHNFDGEYCLSDITYSAILQDFQQYQMTVKENLELGCGGNELPEDKICQILRKIDLYDFIMAKPNGIYTKLGQLENGVELSKGQWQRLAIGRLLANDKANCWILDEPTAYLDPLAEIEMYKLIYQLAGDKTVFFISHRLGFAKFSDRIIVVGDGIILEDGSHQELMEKPNSKYSEMYRTQQQWYT